MNKIIKLHMLTLVALSVAACSGHVKKIDQNKYVVNYVSYKSEEDARKQAVFYARFECTGHGKIVNILSEEKTKKMGYLHTLEFECND